MFNDFQASKSLGLLHMKILQFFAIFTKTTAGTLQKNEKMDMI